MRAARMHGYNQPLVLEDVPIPDIEANEVLVKVAAAGMCRTDVQLIDGYFRRYNESTFPLTPGQEIAGVADKVGSLVPKAAGLEEGDQVVVVGGWGDETCRHCHEGNTQVQQGKIRHTVKAIAFDEINDNLDLLRAGDVVGRAVVKY